MAAAVFLEKNSKNGRAAELYALKKKGFIHDQAVDDNKLHLKCQKMQSRCFCKGSNEIFVKDGSGLGNHRHSTWLH